VRVEGCGFWVMRCGFCVVGFALWVVRCGFCVRGFALEVWALRVCTLRIRRSAVASTVSPSRPFPVSPFLRLCVAPSPRFIDPSHHRFRSTPAEERRVDGRRHYDRDPTPPPRLPASPPLRFAIYPSPRLPASSTRPIIDSAAYPSRNETSTARGTTTEAQRHLPASPSLRFPIPRPITFFIDDSADAGREMVDSTGRA
jgi:hypothetical protein